MPEKAIEEGKAQTKSIKIYSLIFPSTDAVIDKLKHKFEGTRVGIVIYVCPINIRCSNTLHMPSFMSSFCIWKNRIIPGKDTLSTSCYGPICRRSSVEIFSAH